MIPNVHIRLKKKNMSIFPMCLTFDLKKSICTRKIFLLSEKCSNLLNFSFEWILQGYRVFDFVEKIVSFVKKLFAKFGQHFRVKIWPKKFVKILQMLQSFSSLKQINKIFQIVVKYGTNLERIQRKNFTIFYSKSFDNFDK